MIYNALMSVTLHHLFGNFSRAFTNALWFYKTSRRQAVVNLKQFGHLSVSEIPYSWARFCFRKQDKLSALSSQRRYQSGDKKHFPCWNMSGSLGEQGHWNTNPSFHITARIVSIIVITMRIFEAIRRIRAILVSTWSPRSSENKSAV